MTMELKHFKDHFCYNNLSVMTHLNWTKMRKDERTQSEQTITLLKIYLATINTKKRLKVMWLIRCRLPISAAWLLNEWMTPYSWQTAAACDGKYFIVNQIMCVSFTWFESFSFILFTAEKPAIVLPVHLCISATYPAAAFWAHLY